MGEGIVRDMPRRIRYARLVRACGILLVALCVLPGVATAQPETNPRVLFARGETSFDRGRYEEALVDFAAAYAMAELEADGQSPPDASLHAAPF